MTRPCLHLPGYTLGQMADGTLALSCGGFSFPFHVTRHFAERAAERNATPRTDNELIAFMLTAFVIDDEGRRLALDQSTLEYALNHPPDRTFYLHGPRISFVMVVEWRPARCMPELKTIYPSSESTWVQKWLNRNPKHRRQVLSKEFLFQFFGTNESDLASHSNVGCIQSPEAGAEVLRSPMPRSIAVHLTRIIHQRGAMQSLSAPHPIVSGCQWVLSRFWVVLYHSSLPSWAASAVFASRVVSSSLLSGLKLRAACRA